MVRGKRQDAVSKKSKPSAQNIENRNPKAKISRSEGNRVILRSQESGFGTSDDDLILSTVNQVARVVLRGKPADDEAFQTEINAVIAAIAETKPRDSIELMLTTQMAIIHNTAMDLLRRAMLSEQTFEGVEGNVNQANKLMRTFTAQVEALNKYRTKGQQKITVQHVNVNDGGQAIVGDVGVGNG